MQSTLYRETKRHYKQQQNHEFFFIFFHKVRKQNPKMHANHLIWGKEMTLPETRFFIIT